MIFIERGSEKGIISSQELKQLFSQVLDAIGKKNKVLAIPPDFTRFHSMAGILTQYAWEYYRDNLTDVLPASGTHSPMSEDQLIKMFGNMPRKLFKTHDWRNDVETIGKVPSAYVKEATGGKVSFAWPAQVNKLLLHGGHDLILSIGQVVPHEVTGMANYNKNILVGTGGAAGINKSHFLGAVYGMEKIMGRAGNPVRKVLNYASDRFLKDLPVVYVLTVIGPDDNGRLVVRGFFAGDDGECFNKASELSLKVNVTILETPLKKVVVYLNPMEFKSTWLGNKGIYRTRMAIDDCGELIVLGPGIREFGEDPEIDRLIRKFGYAGTDKVLAYVKENDELQHNLSAAAHLIHGSGEGRFTITYCPGHLTQKEIESVNFHYADIHHMMAKYNPGKLKNGYNIIEDSEEIYYISHPAGGLWAYKENFNA